MSRLPEELIDVDDVLVKHVQGFVAWNNMQEWAGNQQLRFEDYTENWGEIWHVNEEEVERRKKGFFVPDIIEGFEIMEDAGLYLPQIAVVRGLCAVTARRNSLQEVTERVLESIAPGSFSAVVCTVSFDGDQKTKRSKADVAIERGAVGFTDDNITACQAVAAVGLKSRVFGDYPWNKGLLPTGVIRVTSLRELTEQIYAGN